MLPQLDVEQNVQRLQPERSHGEEIAGQDLLLVVGHQMSPAEKAITHRRQYNAVLVEAIANGGLGYLLA